MITTSIDNKIKKLKEYFQDVSLQQIEQRFKDAKNSFDEYEHMYEETKNEYLRTGTIPKNLFTLGNNIYLRKKTLNRLRYDNSKEFFALLDFLLNAKQNLIYLIPFHLFPGYMKVLYNDKFVNCDTFLWSDLSNIFKEMGLIFIPCTGISLKVKYGMSGFGIIDDYLKINWNTNYTKEYAFKIWGKEIPHINYDDILYHNPQICLKYYLKENKLGDVKKIYTYYYNKMQNIYLDTQVMGIYFCTKDFLDSKIRKYYNGTL